VAPKFAIRRLSHHRGSSYRLHTCNSFLLSLSLALASLLLHDKPAGQHDVSISGRIDSARLKNALDIHGPFSWAKMPSGGCFFANKEIKEHFGG
jgi:hypothetical protein